jgi:hypothetical protein
MNGRLNLNSVQSYSKNFANVACNQYFTNKDSISGNDILKFSEVSQINLMIIKILLEKWKEQNDSIKSPYFNFENDQVRLAFNNLMNLLSQNILVKRDEFENLVADAVYQSLFLVVEPLHYFNSKIEALDKKVITKTDLKEINKYIQINNFLIDLSIEKMSNQFISKEDYSDLLHTVYSSNINQLHNPSLYISQLSAIAPVAISELVVLNEINNEVAIKEEVISVSEITVNEEIITTNAFDEIENTVEITKTEQVTIASTITATEENGTIEMETTTTTETFIEEKETIVLVNEEIVVANLNDKFSVENEVETLNEKLKKEGQHRSSVLDELSRKTKIESVKEAIPMFKRFEFINNLFNGENMEYHQAILLIDQSESYDKAVSQLKEKYASKYNWNYSDKKVLELLDLVERRHLD